MAKQSRSPKKKSRGSSNPVMLLLLVVGIVGSAAIAGLWLLPKFAEKSSLSREAAAAELGLEDATKTLQGVKGECSGGGDCSGDDFSVTKARTDKADGYVEFRDESGATPDELKVIALDRVSTAAAETSESHEVALEWLEYTPANVAPTLTAVSFQVTMTGSATSPRDFIAATAASGLVVTIIDATVAPHAAVADPNDPASAPPPVDPEANPLDAPTITSTDTYDWTLTVALWYSSEPGVKTADEVADETPGSPVTTVAGSSPTESTTPSDTVTTVAGSPTTEPVSSSEPATTIAGPSPAEQSPTETPPPPSEPAG